MFRFRRRSTTSFLVGCLLILGAAIAFAQTYDPNHDHGDADPLAGSDIDRLIQQTNVAIQHAIFSLQSNDLSGRRLHAHHVINILEGEGGPNFDGSWGNPGDGHGAIRYATAVVEAADGNVRVWAENALQYLKWAAEEALRATRESNVEASRTAIHKALAFLSAALGRSSDADARGAALAAREALAAQAAAEPEPAPTMTIEIAQFQFADGRPITVPVGATVVWVNNDTAPHAVSANNGTFNSPLLSTGDTFSFTFDEPGVYDYICPLHPTMTHRIIVE